MSERVLQLIARHQAEADALRAKELQRCEQRLSFLQNAKGVLLEHARYDPRSGGDPVAIHHGMAQTQFQGRRRQFGKNRKPVYFYLGSTWTNVLEEKKNAPSFSTSCSAGCAFSRTE